MARIMATLGMRSQPRQWSVRSAMCFQQACPKDRLECDLGPELVHSYPRADRGGGRDVGVKRRGAFSSTPSVSFSGHSCRSDPQRRPHALGATEAAPSRCTDFGQHPCQKWHCRPVKPFLAQSLTGIGAACIARRDGVDSQSMQVSLGVRLRESGRERY